ncbi:hypothetical protein [Pontibacter sp. G13]|uniref:hypothetical protein n=1 Tax=Pontibacter sp. G13 TaxID=3074898 RepID=UPI002889ED30|nr:hypothetical protein [Pontibacter sp. G13]WNJ17156.1 hypothetical protein RJD25_20055 [Pontibacter sp. G13]
MKAIPIIIGTSLAIGIGMFAGFTNLFMMIFLTMLLLIVGGISLIRIFVGEIKNRPSISRDSAQMLGACCLAFIAMLVTSSIRARIQHQHAEELVNRIEQFHDEAGQYPADIDTFSHSRVRYHYSTDSLQSNFHLSFSSDGWHRRWYDSQVGKWESGD